MRSRRRLTALGLCLAAMLLSRPVAAAAPLDSAAVVAALKARAATVNLMDGRLGGPGADSLRAVLRSARFLLVGEPHGFVEVPQVCAALYHEFRATGPAALAIETGPASAHEVERLARERDAVAAFRTFDATYPWALPFYTWREEGEMAASVVRESGVAHDALWGLDQEFMESPAFHLGRMRDRATTSAARTLAERSLADARAGSRRMVADKNPAASWLVAAPDSTFDALDRAFRSDPDARLAIAELRRSRAIYQAWFTGANYANNQTRSRLMKRNLDAALARSRAAGATDAHVMFKFGYEHLMRGRSIMETYEVGNTAHELAEAGGRRAYALLILPLGGTQNAYRPFGASVADTAKAYDPRSDFGWLATGPLAAAADTAAWTLLDLDPLRPRLAGAGASLPRGLERLATAYDAVLVIPSAHAAHLLVPPGARAKD
jgi:hypothetical protein